MERRFSYYLFENFDTEREADNPDNPRRFLGAHTDAVIAAAAENTAFSQRTETLCAEFGREQMAQLLRGGVLREESGMIALDTPVFLREDVEALRRFSQVEAEKLAAQLEKMRGKLESLAQALSGDFPAALHLYHIVCGMVFDGAFMDRLGEAGVIALERLHPTGLDYLVTIYEQCSQLDAFANEALCSYNRAVHGNCALQSFGDSAGARFDAYRFFRLREAGKLSPQFAQVERLAQGMSQAELVDEAELLWQTGACSSAAMALLTAFGYARGGKIAVPVYCVEDKAAIARIEAAVIEALFEPVCALFSALQGTLDITATRHGVSEREIANELWHVLFGAINEALVRSGWVAQPPYRPGEGRYLQSIQMEK